jgi:wyosine [tRNA(Phe)-imidazoG37] synthetase (radical SAM superfamily)
MVSLIEERLTTRERTVVALDRCIYGPVPSRRLGRSLGVDLVPFKTCTYDCIYCQLGRTTRQTIRRRRWLETAEVVGRVREKLDTDPAVIAMAGSGEPTLHAGLGEVIDGIKALTEVPVAVITNGSLLGLPAVQRELAAADVVLPSLDAADAEMYRVVNRPHPGLSFTHLIEGMAAFRRGFAGEIWLEVMLLDGLSGTDEHVEQLASLAARIEPDRVQLNTVVRPPADAAARPVPGDRLAAFADAFSAPAEVIAGAPALEPDQTATSADVLALISRRPCTVADVAAGLGIHRNTALKTLTALVEGGTARRHDYEGTAFYGIAVADARPAKEGP